MLHRPLKSSKNSKKDINLTLSFGELEKILILRANEFHVIGRSNFDENEGKNNDDLKQVSSEHSRINYNDKMGFFITELSEKNKTYLMIKQLEKLYFVNKTSHNIRFLSIHFLVTAEISRKNSCLKFINSDKNEFIFNLDKESICLAIDISTKKLFYPKREKENEYYVYVSEEDGKILLRPTHNDSYFFFFSLLMFI